MIPLRDSTRARRAPLVTWALVAANAAAFAWELSLGPRAPGSIARVAVSPAEILALDTPWLLPARLLAAMFLHGGWLHLAGNMAFLAVFGDDVEGKLRRGRYLLLYLISGLIAAAAQTAATPRSTLPMIGASGAIAGVLGAFLLMFPRARLAGVLPIGCLLLPLRSRAFLFVPGWFALQLVGAFTAAPGSAAGGVAWYAHLAGFAAGPPLVWLLRRR